jgi:hypothetical protein
LKTQQTLRNYHNYLGYSSAFSEFGNLNKTQSLADIVLEGQTFITNAIELFSPMYGEEGLIPNQQCIELEQKIQATLNNIKDFVPLAIDILQDNQEHL